MEIPEEEAKEEEKERKKKKPAKEKHTTKRRLPVPFFKEIKAEGSESASSPRTSKKGRKASTEDEERSAECNYEANPRYCTFANSWSTPCREHSTCLYLCTVLLLRLVHET